MILRFNESNYLTNVFEGKSYDDSINQIFFFLLWIQIFFSDKGFFLNANISMRLHTLL